jgi:hypothetical protein
MKSKQSNQSLFAGIVLLPKTHGSKVGAICGKTTQAYQLGDQFEKRIQLMADWSNFVNAITEPVQKAVALRRVI